MSAFRNKVKTFFITKEYRNSYIVIALIAGGMYSYIRDLMTDQRAWFIIWVTPLTVNMLLLYFLWGYFVEKQYKGKGTMAVIKRYAIDFAGFMIITVIFRFGFDMKSILG